jgi:acylphosphatase
MSEPAKAVRARISGRVQGVWFRGWTVREAQAHGLSGWVRNLRSGDVEAVFFGPSANVDDMLVACWRGPRAAVVAAVHVEATNEIPQPGFRQVDDA